MRATPSYSRSWMVTASPDLLRQNLERMTGSSSLVTLVIAAPSSGAERGSRRCRAEREGAARRSSPASSLAGRSGALEEPLEAMPGNDRAAADPHHGDLPSPCRLVGSPPLQ